VYAAMSETGRGTQPPDVPPDKASNEYAAKAVEHLERALERSIGDSDPKDRAMLSSLYLRTGAYDKAVRLLTELVEQEPGWADGPVLLAQAFASAGRTKEAIAWL